MLTKNKFDAAAEYGNQIPFLLTGNGEIWLPFYSNNQKSISEKDIIKTLLKDMKKLIPKAYRSRVTLHKRIPGLNFEYKKKESGIAWYYGPFNQEGYVGKDGKWELHRELGYSLWVKA